MVNDLQDLMRQNVAAPPPDHLDVSGVVRTGRARARRRRAVVAAGGLAAATVVTLGAVLVSTGHDRAEPDPAPPGPTLSLADATRAVEGRDYRELATYTNRDLNARRGQYIDGVTDDGLALFRDTTRFALMDLASGEKDWLPDLDRPRNSQTWPLELGTDRLVLAGTDGGDPARLVAYVYDRGADEWRTVTWPGLPALQDGRAVLGPDDRVYLFTRDGTSATFDLWSASLADDTDARDEGMTVGDVAFSDTTMVWTDSKDLDSTTVHLRDLASGDESSFDPQAGEGCAQGTLGISGDRIVLGGYCGTLGSDRDDTVQVFETDGDPVVTIADVAIDGWLPPGGDVVNVTTFAGKRGTYAYDLATDRFLRLSEEISATGLGGTTAQPRQILWHTMTAAEATQHLGELLP